MILNSPTISGSLTVTGNILTSGSITLSGSVASASYAATASFVALAQSASNAVAAATASSADNLLVRNTLTAQTLVVQTITSSVDFVTGSTRFGSIAANTHTFTGSVLVSGSGTFVSSITAGDNSIINGSGEVLRLGTSSTDNYIAFRNSSNVQVGDIGYDGRDTNILSIWNNSNGGMLFGTNATERMRITSGGDLVVGGTSAINSSSGRGNITINGTSAIINLGISNVESGYIFHSGTNLDISQVLAQPLRFLTTNSERMRITSGGNVLVGDTSNASGTPTFYVKNKNGAVANIAGWNFGGTTTAENGNNCLLTVGSYYNGSSLVATQTTATNYQQYNGLHVWYTNSGLTAGNTFSNTERMRINSGGGVRVGSATAFNDDIRFNVYGTGVWAGANIGLQNGGTGGKDWIIFSTNNEFGQGGGNLLFYNNSGPTANGLILYANGNYDFGGSDVSDIRLKQDIENLNYGLNEIMALSPKSYHLKSEDNLQEENQTTLRKRYGFIAQEVQSILPDAITGEETETDYLGLDYNGVLTVAVKAIQELKAEFDAYKATHP